MRDNLTVLCVLWSSPEGWHNRSYDWVWVGRLWNAVQQHLTIPHRFICLTNMGPSPFPEIETIPLIDDGLPGVWSKLQLFRSDIPGKQFLYLDLDVLLHGSIDSLVTRLDTYHAGFFGILPSSIMRSSGEKKLNRYLGIASGVMSWERALDLSFLYNEFDPSTMSVIYAGDQDWISYCCNKHGVAFDTYPTSWIRLLRDLPVNPDKLPDSCKVICCSPNGWRQDIVTEYKGPEYKWVQEMWRKGSL